MVFSSLSVRAGRFDVFEHRWKKSSGEQMYIMDANSLYASIARDLKVPVGTYEIITNMSVTAQIKFDSTKQAYFLNGTEMVGFAMLEVFSPSSEIPFIGVNVGQKYIYTLCNECAKKKKKSTCRHGEKSRKIIATLTWPEIKLWWVNSDIQLDIYLKFINGLKEGQYLQSLLASLSIVN